MSGNEKINVKINKNWGITQALKKLVKDAGENVKGSVWNATLDKLVELNNQRKRIIRAQFFQEGQNATIGTAILLCTKETLSFRNRKWKRSLIPCR